MERKSLALKAYGNWQISLAKRLITLSEEKTKGQQRKGVKIVDNKNHIKYNVVAV